VQCNKKVHIDVHTKRKREREREREREIHKGGDILELIVKTVIKKYKIYISKVNHFLNIKYKGNNGALF